MWALGDPDIAPARSGRAAAAGGGRKLSAVEEAREREAARIRARENTDAMNRRAAQVVASAAPACAHAALAGVCRDAVTLRRVRACVLSVAGAHSLHLRVCVLRTDQPAGRWQQKPRQTLRRLHERETNLTETPESRRSLMQGSVPLPLVVAARERTPAPWQDLVSESVQGRQQFASRLCHGMVSRVASSRRPLRGRPHLSLPSLQRARYWSVDDDGFFSSSLCLQKCCCHTGFGVYMFSPGPQIA